MLTKIMLQLLLESCLLVNIWKNGSLLTQNINFISIDLIQKLKNGQIYFMYVFSVLFTDFFSFIHHINSIHRIAYHFSSFQPGIHSSSQGSIHPVGMPGSVARLSATSTGFSQRFLAPRRVGCEGHAKMCCVVCLCWLHEGQVSVSEIRIMCPERS